MVVSTKGTFKDYKATSARTTYVITDSKRDGNPVYGRTRFLFWDKNPVNEYGWQFKASRKTAEFQNTTQTHYSTYNYLSGLDKVRGEISVCAQMGWPVPDSCVPAVFKSYSY